MVSAVTQDVAVMVNAEKKKKKIDFHIFLSTTCLVLFSSLYEEKKKRKNDSNGCFTSSVKQLAPKKLVNYETGEIKVQLQKKPKCIG